jgi:hypothetical protein
MESLIEFVENYKKSNPSGWRKWVLGSVAVVVILVVILVYSVRETLRQREIARLRHERDMLHEQIQNQTVNTQLDVLSDAQSQHQAAAQNAMQQAAAIDAQLESLEAQHKKNVELINSIKSWDDVDARVN